MLGERYQRHRASLAVALEQLERQVKDSLAARERREQRLAKVSTFVPLALALLMPGALFIQQTYPWLWWVTLGVAVGALALLGATLARPLPRFRVLGQLTTGDSFMVEGRRYRAVACFDFCFKASIFFFRRMVLLRDEQGAQLALTIEHDPADASYFARSHLWAEGGEPWSVGQSSEGNEPSAARWSSAEEGPLAGQTQITYAPALDSAGQALGSLRVFAGPPSAGEAPLWTFTPERKIPEEQLALLNALG